MGKSIIMSDIHFGLRGSNLNINPSDNNSINKKRIAKIDEFFDWLKKMHEDVDEFIFNGDLFDLHLQNFSRAINGSYYFLKKFIRNSPPLSFWDQVFS